MPNPEKAQNFQSGVNYFVPDCQLHSDVGTDGIHRQYSAYAPPALSATGIFNAQTIAVAGTFYPTNFSRTNMGEYGRALSLVASGAATGTVIVRGRDYLGAPMREDFALNGATPVAGKKAFAYVDSITTPAVAATTINLGYLDIFGMQFCSETLLQENVNDAATGNAGTFVSAVKTDPATATTGDTRGTYAPNAANAANGVRTYRLTVLCDKNKLYGVKQYYA